MVLKRALDELVQDIWCEELVYISAGEIIRKWLET
jgi:hypothetical protein